MKKILLHLLLPLESNNYRAKLLHPKSLIFAILLVFSLSFLISVVKTTFPSVLGTSSNIQSDQLLAITNQKRQEYGLSPLTSDPRLSQAAENKGLDMFSKDYWAHNSPDGETPWVFIKAAGYNYVYAGENLARGFNSASDVINAWMASPEHKQNMLSSNYTNVGFAVVTGKLTGEDTVLIVEELGSTNMPVLAENPQKTVEVVPQPSSKTEVAQTPPVVENKPNQLVLEAQHNAVIKPFINSSSFSFNLAKALVLLFIFVLVIDMIAIERKKIVRFVGHNFDHILFLTLILGLIIVLSKGFII
jgi:hypothetical protein